MNRAIWLESLVPGSPATFVLPMGPRPAIVRRLCADKIWLSVDSGIEEYPAYEVWVWRDTGNCPPAHTRIEPHDAVLPIIGGDPDADDSMTGGWEAA